MPKPDTDATAKPQSDAAPEGAKQDQAASGETQEPCVEIGGKQVPISQIKQWQKGHMQEADYTQKTQALSTRERELAEREQRDAAYLESLGLGQPQMTQEQADLQAFLDERDSRLFGHFETILFRRDHRDLSDEDVAGVHRERASRGGALEDVYDAMTRVTRDADKEAQIAQLTQEVERLKRGAPEAPPTGAGGSGTPPLAGEDSSGMSRGEVLERLRRSAETKTGGS